MDSKVAGGVLLIVGTSIGAGMLALPMVTASSGFIGSLILFIACWAVMTFSALLMLEVNLWLPARTNIISMARATLGRPGALVAWLSYTLLLYSVLAAYVSGGSSLFHDFLLLLGINLPLSIGSILFVIAFGYIVYRGIKPVDYVNRGLMVTKLGTLFALIFFTFPYVDPKKLIEGNPLLLASTITVVLTSFGFANIIPSLRSYFNDNVKQLRFTILVGSIIPLVCYIFWEFAILGTLPHQGENSLQQMMDSGGSTAQLTHSLSGYLHNTSITLFSRIFTSVCVLTSFLSVALGLSDFLADGLKVEKKGKGNYIVFGATFLPPLVLILFYPSIFIQALNYAGMFCVILFILLPALMIWSGRYRKQLTTGRYQVRGGKPALVILMIIGLIMIAFGFSQMG